MKMQHEQRLLPIQQKIQSIQNTLGPIDLTADTDGDDAAGADDKDDESGTYNDIPVFVPPNLLSVADAFSGDLHFRTNVSQTRSSEDWTFGP